MKVHLIVGVLALVFIAVSVGYVVSGSAARAAAQKYPGDPATGEPVKTPSGLMYYDLKVGTGPTPAGPTSRVRVHYTGWLLSGTKFDSSIDKGQPFTTALTDVVAGWTEGVGSMKVGGKRKLIIPPDLGYKFESKPDIPAGSTLVFDIELLGLE